MIELHAKLLPAGLLFLVFCLLCACGAREPLSLTWQPDSLPDNLDPQLAADDGDITAVRHLYSGLFRADENGIPWPDCCESWSLSPDRLLYRFTLRPGITWLGLRGAECTVPVTADDFVFALQRVFLPVTASPWAEMLGGIAGAGAVLKGADPALLAVTAPNTRTLCIRLTAPDPDFLQKLCCPGALPCCRAFFEQSGGRYGLDGPHTRGNGPFYISNWTSSGLFLAREATPDRVSRLRLVAGPEGVTAALRPAEPGDPAAFSLRTWCLVPNCEAEPFCRPLFRQALAAVARNNALPTPDGLRRTGRLLPGSLRSGPLLPPTFGANGRTLWAQGLAEENLHALHGLTLLLPPEEECPPGLSAALDRLHQHWQRNLGVYFRLRRLPVSQLLRLRQTGSYTLLLLPLQAQSTDPGAVLTQWCGTPDEAAALAEARLIPLFAQPQKLWTQLPLRKLCYNCITNSPDVTGAVLIP